jgi:hypothetical protein
VGCPKGRFIMTTSIKDSDHTYNLNFQTLEETDHLSESNREEIKKYCQKLLSRGTDKSTVLTRISRFHSVLKLAADNDFELREANKEDLERIISRINTLEHHSVRTKSDYRGIIEDYYKLVEGDTDTCPDKADFID